MSNVWAAFSCATVLWVVCTIAAVYGFPKRPAGEAWVVTASDKMTIRPMLVRAHVPFRSAGMAGSLAR